MPLDSVRPLSSPGNVFRPSGIRVCRCTPQCSQLSSSPLLAPISWNTTLGNIHSVQPAPNQIDVVQAGDDGECESGAEKCLFADPDPFRVVNLQQHDKYDSRQLGERICFAENAGAKIAQPGNCV